MNYTKMAEICSYPSIKTTWQQVNKYGLHRTVCRKKNHVFPGLQQTYLPESVNIITEINICKLK